MGYQIVVLIDHAGHSVENSVYSLCRGLLRQPEVQEVLVVSRSTAGNRAFFFDLQQTRVLATRVSENFKFDPTGRQFDAPFAHWVEIGKADLILLRLPHPIYPLFFDFLEKKVDSRCIINRPSGIEITGSKAFLLELQEVCPPIQLCRTIEQVIEFHQKYDLVLKPLRNYGGMGIYKLQNGMLSDAQGKVTPLTSGSQLLQAEFDQGGLLAMKFLQNVSQGDKRIVVVNGQVVGASLRKPPDGSWLCNVSQGGTSERSILTPEEKDIVDYIHGKIAPLGIGIFGTDTLVDDDGKRVLSEINTMSVGGIGPMELQTQSPVSDKVAIELLNYFKYNLT